MRRRLVRRRVRPPGGPRGPARQRQVTPPSSWTWDECTVAVPPYEDGLTCLDFDALRCGLALLRRGSVELGGAWGEAFAAQTALRAANQAHAAVLLASEIGEDGEFTPAIESLSP